MFEFSVALRYLIPRKKSVSTALISLMSVLVISLVVWLVIVFLSVTSGIEKNWLKKLTTLHAPLRISPTETYYKSYFYQIDGLSASSQYTLKTIGEKAASLVSDPYASESDIEVPIYWPKAERLKNGELVDPVKKAYQIIDQFGLSYQDYEIGGALLKLQRRIGGSVSQMSYLLSKPEKNPYFKTLLIESEKVDGEEEPILLPKGYKDSGVEIGDVGTLNFSTATALSSIDQKIAVRVSGFYDPGLVSTGGKCIIVPKSITRTIHASTQILSPDGTPTNGIFVWFENLQEASALKEKIQKEFEKAGIDKYWKVDTFRDFEFSKDFLLQFQSDKTLLLLIAAIILLVACTNIISLLVLLVNDKKKEIAILRSMGASLSSIALIFGTCGIFMGMISCLIGSFLALFTLKHIQTLASFLSALQGHVAFNPTFFGQTLPNEISFDSLLFVLIATPILSLAAGLIPALKASRIDPSSALRS